jgi:hypothetical protein
MPIHDRSTWHNPIRAVRVSKRLKARLAVVVLVVSAVVVGSVFWHMEVVYSLPTPVPADHRNVEVGSPITLEGPMAQPAGMPVFLHFFNPRCPCSRFNLPEVKALVRKYQDRIAFRVVVVPPEGKRYSGPDAYRDIGMDIPVSFDRSIAAACGVYSTPQAVLIDAGGKLFYRGNYNKHRYCTAAATNYARMAIDSLLAGTERIHPERAALLSYGCSLPKCTKD